MSTASNREVSPGNRISINIFLGSLPEETSASNGVTAMKITNAKKFSPNICLAEETVHY